MKKLVYLLFVLLFVLVSCGKDDPDPPEPPPPPPPKKIEVVMNLDINHASFQRTIILLVFSVCEYEDCSSTGFRYNKEINVSNQSAKFSDKLIITGADADKLINKSVFVKFRLGYLIGSIPVSIYETKTVVLKNGENIVNFTATLN